MVRTKSNQIPISSVRALNSDGSVNSSALNGIAPSAVSDTKDFKVEEKQMWPALTLRKSISEYLKMLIRFLPKIQ